MKPAASSVATSIFAAQALMVRDAAFRSAVVTLVRDRKVNVEGAVADVIERFTQVFDQIPDPYLRERADDIRDVGRRVLAALVQGWGGPGLLESYEMERRPVAARIVKQAAGNFMRDRQRASHPAIAEDSPEGERARRGQGFHRDRCRLTTATTAATSQMAATIKSRFHPYRWGNADGLSAIRPARSSWLAVPSLASTACISTCSDLALRQITEPNTRRW